MSVNRTPKVLAWVIGACCLVGAGLFVGTFVHCGVRTNEDFFTTNALWFFLWNLAPFAVLALPLLVVRTRVGAIFLSLGAIGGVALWGYVTLLVFTAREACDQIIWVYVFGTSPLLVVGLVAAAVAMLTREYARHK